MRKIRGLFIASVIALSAITGYYTINTNALEGDPFNEPVKIRCTCYTDSGTTASGKETKYGYIAGRKEWLGCVAFLYKVNEDGSVGENIGLFMFEDTGYGRETGYGVSEIKKNKTLGTIEAGETVDVYMPTQHQVDEWLDNVGDEVYIKIVRGVG